MLDFAQAIFAFFGSLLYLTGRMSKEKIQRDFFMIMLVLIVFSISFAYIF